jgi:hypothetical protein
VPGVTRVRGLLLDGRFWHPRFQRLPALIPRQVVPAWPEFLLDGKGVTGPELCACRYESP